MIKAVAFDNEPKTLKVIEQFCNRIDYVKLEKTFVNHKDALKYLNKFPVDLLFLVNDIPDFNGIQFYKTIKQSIMVIFISNSEENAIEGFNLNAIDFLLKPFTFERFLASVNKAKKNCQSQTQSDNQETSPYLFVKADFSLIKINLNEIIYIEALKDYVKIVIRNQKSIITHSTMKGILEKLPSKDFIRVHRSFIVRLDKMESIINNKITINKREIPIGINFSKPFIECIKKTNSKNK